MFVVVSIRALLNPREAPSDASVRGFLTRLDMPSFIPHLADVNV